MNTTTKRFTVIVGIVMTFAMVGSLLIPLFSGQVGYTENLAETPGPTPLPEPTFPPPPDISAIDFDSLHLHQSGLFTMAVPTGWEAGSDSNTPDELRASLSNSDAQSVVEARIIKNYNGISDAGELDAFFGRDWLNQSWREYWDWEETSRKITDDGHVVIDFNLRRSRTYFIARQESWLQNGEIYSARVVTAENAPQAVKFLLSGVVNSLQRLEVYLEAPFGWNGYFDNLDKHMIRYPSGWLITDAADGLPATFVGEDVTLALETLDVALSSETDAIDWIEKSRGGVEAVAVEPAEVGEAKGYRISYRLTTLDGDIESGLAIVLHGADNRLHVANARIGGVDVDLLQVNGEEFGLRAVLDSFRLLPWLDVTVG